MRSARVLDDVCQTDLPGRGEKTRPPRGLQMLSLSLTIDVLLRGLKTHKRL